MNYLDEIMRQLDDLRRQVAALQRIEALTDATYVKLAGRSGGQRVSGIASTGYALEVYRNLAAASTNSAVFAVTQDNASDDQDALRVQQDGSGDVVELLDGATVVLRVLDGGRLDVYNIIRALTASGLRLEDDGGNLGLFVEDGGNVGINTAAPDDQIHIAGNVRISGTNIIQLKPGAAGSLEVLDVTTPTSNKNVGIRLLPSGTATRSQIEMWNDSDTANGGRVNLSVSGDTMLFEPAVSGTGTAITKIAFSSGDVIFGGTTPSGQLHVDQSSTIGAKPVLVLDQADLSEEFIEFVTTVGAGNPIDTAAIGTYYGKIRVNVTGVGYKYIPLHNTWSGDSMAFPKEAVRIPVAVSDISIQLYSPDPTGSETARAEYSVQVRFSDGSLRVVAGDLVPHLSQGQINGLLSFMADMRTKANTEILPE